MKLSHKIFLSYLVVVLIAAFFLLKSVQDELRPAMRQSMEETLVDTANLLAEIVQEEVLDDDIDDGDFAAAMQAYLYRRPEATIWGMTKVDTAFRIYITDDTGIVIYDSEFKDAIGDDYSQWNDVYLTLRGEYGARSTRSRQDDPTSSTMYVAAPVMHKGNIVGVLTVAKPTLSIVPFIELSQRNIIQAGLILMGMALVLGWFVSHLLAGSVRRLVDYANRVKAGEKVVKPDIAEQELSQLADAMESMRIALEGKDYIEQYVHSLTHEIKSPISGIKGALELLSEEMDIKDRQRFIRNIMEDASRIQNIVDRLLDLATLEQQQMLHKREAVELKNVIDDVAQSYATQLQQKSLSVESEHMQNVTVMGDPFLIRQAISNVLDNAIDFSPEGARIHISTASRGDRCEVVITDEGEGIPDYAKNKIFDRFYSLPRPDTGKKSSGLGLSFVKEVMALHHGNASVSSDQTGCSVTLSFPIE